jgi:hypothetical protein
LGNRDEDGCVGKRGLSVEDYDSEKERGIGCVRVMCKGDVSGKWKGIRERDMK